MVAQVDKSFLNLARWRLLTRLTSYLFYEGRPLTTRGRWFNKIVFFLFRIQAVIPITKPVDRPIFVLGTGRSGTTILGVTLGIHSEVGFLNEPKAVWAHACPNEDLIGSYNFNAARYFLDESDCSNKTKVTLQRIYSHYLTVTRSHRVVDKYPELIFRIGFVREIFPDAKFIFLYRNGNDTVASIEHWSERLGLDDGEDRHDWWGVNDRKWYLLCDQVVVQDVDLKKHHSEIREFVNHRDRAAVEWILTMRQGLKIAEQYRDDVYLIKYEDYVSSSQSRSELLAFCGLEENAIYSTYCDAVLSPVRGVESIELPIQIAEVFKQTMQELGYAD
jgi:hypothetical protein